MKPSPPRRSGRAAAAAPRGLPTRGARRRERTRARLVEAARRVIARKGVDPATIAEITDEADVGFGSFYNHFASKEEIVEAVIAAAMEAHGAALDRLAASIEDPAEVMAVSIRHTVRMVDHDPIWGWFVVRVGLAFDSMRAALGHRALRDLEAGLRAGRFRVNDPEVALLVIGGANLAVMRARLEGRAPADVDAVVAEQLLVLLGIEAAEGREIARRPLPPVLAEGPAHGAAKEIG